MRSALRRLAWENLVVILPRRGTLVAELDVGRPAEIFELRVELEGLAARLAAERAGDEQRAALRRSSSARAAPSPTATSQALIELDHELHAAIATAAGNTLLEASSTGSTATCSGSGASRSTASAPSRASVAEHEAVVDAIVRGDAKSAHDRMQAHVRRFQAAFLESENAKERRT